MASSTDRRLPRGTTDEKAIPHSSTGEELEGIHSTKIKDAITVRKVLAPRQPNTGSPQTWSTRPFFRSLLGLLGCEVDWPDGRLLEIKYEKIDIYPNGYPRLAAYINSDHNFLVFRKFGTARNRVLLHRQQEVAAAEQALNELDRSNEKQDFTRRLKTIYKDENSAESDEAFRIRQSLVEDLSEKLAEYDKLLLREAQIVQLDAPARKNYLSLYHWIWNLKPVVRSEGQFLSPANDFVILSGQGQESVFRIFLERLIFSMPRAWSRLIFANEQQKRATSETAVALADRNRVDILVRAIIVVTTAFMVLVPAMTLLDSRYTETIAIFSFTLGFALSVSVFARLNNFNLIAATAAYSTVLCVLLAMSQ